MTEHLTDSQVAALRSRSVPPEEAFELLEHAASCGQCQERVMSSTEVALEMASLREALGSVHAHLSLDEINDLVFGSLPAFEADRLGEHLAECGTCSQEVTQLRGIAETERRPAAVRMEEPRRRSLTEWMISLFTMPRMALAAGVMVLLAAVGGWVALHRHAAEPKTARVTVPSRPEAAGSPGAGAQADANGTAASHPAVLGFVLLPGVNRGGGVEQSLRVPGQAELVRLTMTSRARLTPGRYLVSISSAAGRSVWTKELSYGRAPRSVSVELSASLLSEGRYVMTLYAVEAGKPNEDLDEYAFRIVR